MTSDGQFDADELLFALQQIESICRVRETCQGCMFSEKESERNVCRFVDSPYTWEFLSIEKLEGGESAD